MIAAAAAAAAWGLRFEVLKGWWKEGRKVCNGVVNERGIDGQMLGLWEGGVVVLG